MQDEIAAVMQTFQQFSAANRERCESPQGFNHALQSWSTSDWFTAIMGELGEAANVAKKLNRVRDGIPGNKESEAALRDKLRRELADTFVYLDLLCQALGFNIGDAAIEVFNAKSAEIGYPLLLADRLSAASSSPRGTQDWYERAVKARNTLAGAIKELRGGHSSKMDGCDLALAGMDIVLGLSPYRTTDRLSAASSSPETRGVNAELLAALKDVVDDAVGETGDPLWVVRAEVISRGALAVAKAAASPQEPKG
jgi:NTP pyrophosphatase (non-canonical NTP hydrolase)